MEELNQDAVFFRCRICSFEFQADPNFIPIPCPQCGSAGLYYEAGLVTGYKYHCKDCDYVGAFVIEKDIPAPKNGQGQG